MREREERRSEEREKEGKLLERRQRVRIGWRGGEKRVEEGQEREREGEDNGEGRKRSG